MLTHEASIRQLLGNTTAFSRVSTDHTMVAVHKVPSLSVGHHTSPMPTLADTCRNSPTGVYADTH